MSDSTERNCNKCIHHTSGYCDSWNCKMQTVEDVKKEAAEEYNGSWIAIKTRPMTEEEKERINKLIDMEIERKLKQ